MLSVTPDRSTGKISWRLALLLIAIVFIILALAMGPRPQIDESIHFDPSVIGSDIDGWLATREAAVPGLKPGAEKEIVWADPATKAKTPIAIVYVHGFSATKWEMRPLPDEVASALGANLFFTRLTGHGQDGEALAKANMNDWINDMAEAIAVGERIGERIIIIGGSTGGTLATWATGNARLINKVIGLVLISPNYQLRGISTDLLNMPWGKYVLPLVFGRIHSFEPVNEQQAHWWTTSYPSAAILNLAALMQAVDDMDQGRRTAPAFFIFSPNDEVVSPVTTRHVYNEWGGPKKMYEVEKSGDPSNHVVAGDILSPQTTDDLVQRIVSWAGTLGR